MSNGITIERASHSKTPCYVRIDLRKYGEELRPFLESKGVQLDIVTNYTKKLQKATWEIEHGEWVKGDRSKLWDV
jgi:hypothetical protein